MKKWLMVAVFATLVLGACGGEKDKSVAETDEPVEEAEGAEAEDQVAVDAESELVEVTIPAEFTYGIEEDPEMKELFEDITTNDDGSVTYTIEEELHTAFMEGLTEQFDVVIEEIVNTYPSFQLIEYTETYDEFDLHIDLAQFDEESDVVALVQLVALAGTYNGFAGVGEEDISITANLIDAETEEVIETMVYPEK